MCGNRVDELESRVQELEASVTGLTDELVECKVRLRELEEAEQQRAASDREAAESGVPDTAEEEILTPTTADTNGGATTDADVTEAVETEPEAAPEPEATTEPETAHVETTTPEPTTDHTETADTASAEEERTDLTDGSEVIVPDEDNIGPEVETQTGTPATGESTEAADDTTTADADDEGTATEDETPENSEDPGSDIIVA